MCKRVNNWAALSTVYRNVQPILGSLCVFFGVAVLTHIQRSHERGAPKKTTEMATVKKNPLGHMVDDLNRTIFFKKKNTRPFWPYSGHSLRMFRTCLNDTLRFLVTGSTLSTAMLGNTASPTLGSCILSTCSLALLPCVSAKLPLTGTLGNTSAVGPEDHGTAWRLSWIGSNESV